jgi:hypothetical protein
MNDEREIEGGDVGGAVGIDEKDVGRFGAAPRAFPIVREI